MADSAPNLQSFHVTKGQKRLRKGTHSCTECRRRKIRCVIPLGETSCSPCLSRGSRCIDQRSNNDMRGGHAIISHQSPFDGTVESSDIENLVNGTNNRAPFISALDDAELLRPANPRADAGNQMSFAGPAVLSSSVHSQTQHHEKEAQSVCKTLRSVLPSFDNLISTLSMNGAWWSSFRRKTHALSSKPVEPLITFAARTYTSTNPAELGVLVAAYARSVEKGHHLYATVERLIISEPRYSTTIEGMECLILLGKSYTDIGQPRRAWYMWQRGVAVAKLMGYYREDADSAQQRIWWSIYHGDRFTSMLLNLPYGFNDAHLGLATDATTEKPESLQYHFILRCAFIAGKVIDRNIVAGKPSFSKAMDMDEQMDSIAASMPEDWWHIPDELPRPGPDLEYFTERLLQQLYFFHIKMYVHLPFIAKSAITSPSQASGSICMEASRQMLKRFQLLRDNVQRLCLFECKTSDFVGFTAAIVLLLGLSQIPSSQRADDDLHLVASIEKIFRKEESENNCKIASQYRKTLNLLGNNSSITGSSKDHQIRIPYFGTLIRRSMNGLPTNSVNALSDSTHGGNESYHPSLLGSTDSFATGLQNGPVDTSTLEYLAYSAPDTSVHFGLGDYNYIPASGQSSWLNQVMMDIDMDWDTFPSIGSMFSSGPH